MKIFEIGINDGEYPKLLKETSDPPEKIYACGNLDLLNDKMISIVGSRKCSEYGKNVAYKLGEQLANNGVTVVSGLALGIDSFAHRGALNGEGKTIAVLACGIDQYYPMQNHSLQDRIYKEGLIISEKPGNYKAKNYDFPRRNRIIAGLSLGTCIVEAAVKSGSLITASFALNENRQVYAVPGNITNMQSFGANQLIKEGALCVTGFNDILYDLGINPDKSSNDLS
ncbi:MAG: DNA-processing protein DprA [Clostridia bacterium]|nr:DNA-processing protein DprA [Clostridia bacterium]